MLFYIEVITKLCYNYINNKKGGKNMKKKLRLKEKYKTPLFIIVLYILVALATILYTKIAPQPQDKPHGKITIFK